jgi:hypothetical protein
LFTKEFSELFSEPVCHAGNLGVNHVPHAGFMLVLNPFVGLVSVPFYEIPQLLPGPVVCLCARAVG